MALPAYKDAKRLSIYLSMPNGELSTREIVRDALESGKDVFVPYIRTTSPKNMDEGWPKSVIDMLQLHGLRDYEGLKPDKWGIPSLDPESSEVRTNCLGGTGAGDGTQTIAELWDRDLDLVVVPGMAFDEELGRLGHGRGYYDVFFARLSGRVRQKRSRRMPLLGQLRDHIRYEYVRLTHSIQSASRCQSSSCRLLRLCLWMTLTGGSMDS